MPSDVTLVQGLPVMTVERTLSDLVEDVGTSVWLLMHSARLRNAETWISIAFESFSGRWLIAVG